MTGPACSTSSTEPAASTRQPAVERVKRRTMAINQLKAQVHLWLDQTPGDLTRARNVTVLAALISAAQLSPQVRQALADMTAEIASLSRRVGDLDATIRKLVSPLATSLLQVTGISYNSAAVLLAEIGDITRSPAQPSSPATAAAHPSPVYFAGGLAVARSVPDGKAPSRRRPARPRRRRPGCRYTAQRRPQGVGRRSVTDRVDNS
jgi:transposase